MSATYKGSMVILSLVEGGYCVGKECGSANSGETYRGIDRKFHASWPGWKIIDAYKKKYGRPKRGSFIKDPALDIAVEQFYNTFWLDRGMNNFKNQTLAALVWALIVHRQNMGIAHINSVAKSMGATKFSSTSITANVAQSIERGMPNSYAVVWKSIENYYRQFKKIVEDSNPRVTQGTAFINGRLKKFPETLTAPAQSQPLITNNPGIDAAGMAMLVYKMFF